MNSWITIDFGQNIAIKPTHYTLRHSKGWDNSYMKSWSLVGSLDGVCWELISKHSHWTSPFGKAGKSKTFEIKHCSKYYNAFKVQLTGKDSDGEWCICANGFELYGYVECNKD